MISKSLPAASHFGPLRVLWLELRDHSLHIPLIIRSSKPHECASRVKSLRVLYIIQTIKAVSTTVAY